MSQLTDKQTIAAYIIIAIMAITACFSNILLKIYFVILIITSIYLTAVNK